MNDWIIKENKKIKIKKSILIVGLPGIGNVGKTVIDFLNDEFETEEIIKFNSKKFPNVVFVNEEDLISSPEITLNYKRIKNRNFLFLTGDIQPSYEDSCYEFCENIDKLNKKLNVELIITIGGIGLKSMPKKPLIYATGNNRKTIDKFCEKTKIKTDIFGVVGPIIGINGMLPGISKIPSIIILIETLASQLNVDMKGVKHIIEILNNKYNLNADIKKLTKEIKKIEKENLKNRKDLNQFKDSKEITNYFG